MKSLAVLYWMDVKVSDFTSGSARFITTLSPTQCYESRTDYVFRHAKHFGSRRGHDANDGCNINFWCGSRHMA